MSSTFALAIGVVIGWVLQSVSPPGLAGTINGVLTQTTKKLCDLFAGLLSPKPQSVASPEAPKPKTSTVKKPVTRDAKKPAPANKKPVSAKSPDDLKKIEGIGPKIAELLQQDGISTFLNLANAKQDRLKGILEKAGSRYRIAEPSSWPEQARLAKSGKWDELKKLQQKLKGGRQTK